MIQRWDAGFYNDKVKPHVYGAFVKHAAYIADVARWAEALREVLYNAPHKSQARHVARALLEQYDKEAASATSKT